MSTESDNGGSSVPDANSSEIGEATLDGQGPSEQSKGGDGAADSEIADAHVYLKGLIEALLFVAETPLSIKELARAAKIDRKRAAELLEEIQAQYKDRGLNVQEVAEGFCFRSNPTYATYIRGHLAQRPVRLSRAQLETLAIIAYRQPITRPEVDDIRGVDSGPVLKGLLERDLIKILGKKDEPGRPMLYGTSAAFLELFNMKSLQDLPTLKEFTELSEESRLKFEQALGIEAPEGPLEAAFMTESDQPPPGSGPSIVGTDAGTADAPTSGGDVDAEGNELEGPDEEEGEDAVDDEDDEDEDGDDEDEDEDNEDEDEDNEDEDEDDEDEDGDDEDEDGDDEDEDGDDEDEDEDDKDEQ